MERMASSTGCFLTAIPSVRQAITWVKDAPLEAGGGFEAAYTLFQAYCDYAETGALPYFGNGEWLTEMLFYLNRRLIDAAKTRVDEHYNV